MGKVDFMGGVFTSADTDTIVVSIDPQTLDRGVNKYSASNIQIVRDALGFSVDNLGNSAPLTVIQSMIDGALDSTPAALPFEIDINGIDPSVTAQEMVKVCVVMEEDWYSDSKEEMVTILSGVPVDKLKNIPGSEALWDKAVGIHEGTHCERPQAPVTVQDTLTDEVRADMNAVSWLRDNGHKDVAEALIDYRILGSVHKIDVVHADGMALQLGGTASITADYMTAAQSIRSQVLGVIRDEHGVGSLKNAEKYIAKFPKRCIETVEKALFNGEFKDAQNPDLEIHVHAYTQAFRRQMNGVTPLPPIVSVNLNDIKGSYANVDLTGDGHVSMTIGEVSAPEFFASIADPNLAAERIALQEIAMQNTSTTQEQIITAAIKV